jgi:hypothetical protein
MRPNSVNRADITADRRYPMTTGHVLAIQVDGKLEVATDISTADVAKFVERFDSDVSRRLERAEAKHEAVRSEVAGDPNLAVEYFQLRQKEAERDELLTSDLSSLDSDAVLKRVEQYHRYTDVGSALLYQHADYRGSARFCTITWPNFKWPPYCFNDAASSAKAWGVNILFEHSWYRGRKLYLIGLPFVQFPSFEPWHFNDTASSFASIP